MKTADATSRASMRRTRRSLPMARRRGAMTVIEALLTLTILMIGAAGFMAIMQQARGTSEVMAHRRAAVNLAEQVLVDLNRGASVAHHASTAGLSIDVIDDAASPPPRGYRWVIVTVDFNARGSGKSPVPGEPVRLVGLASVDAAVLEVSP